MYKLYNVYITHVKELANGVYIGYSMSKVYSFRFFIALFSGNLEQYIPVQKAPLFLIDYLAFGNRTFVKGTAALWCVNNVYKSSTFKYFS